MSRKVAQSHTEEKETFKVTSVKQSVYQTWPAISGPADFNNFRTFFGAFQQHGLVVRDSRVLRVEQARGNTLQDRSTTSDDRRDESFLEGTHAYSTKASGDRNSYADAGGGLGSDQHRGSQAGGQNQGVTPNTNVETGVAAITATVNLIIS